MEKIYVLKAKLQISGRLILVFILRGFLYSYYLFVVN